MAEAPDPKYEAALRDQNQQQQDLDRAQKALRRNALDSVDRVNELIDGYEKLAKAMDLSKLNSKASKLEAAAKKQQATMKLLERFSDYSPVYVSKMLTGGFSPKELDGIIKMVTSAGKAKGKNHAMITEDVKATIAKIHGLQDKINQAILDGNQEALDAYQKQAESLIEEIGDNGQAMLDAATQQVVAIRQANDEVAKKIAKLASEGKANSLRYKLLMMTEAGGGKGIAGTAIEKLLEKEKKGGLLGTMSKGVGLGETAQKFTGEDGKWSWSKATAQFASMGHDRLKQGWNSYLDTGRQFGMENISRGSLLNTYQNTSSKIAGVRWNTGRDEQEVTEAMKQMAPAIRAGNASMVERQKIQLEVTEQALKYERVINLSVPQQAALVAAYRKNLGYSASQSMKAIGQVHEAMETINASVEEGGKLASEDLHEAFMKVASDIDSAGINMKKFSSYLQASYVYSKNLGIPLAKALDIAQKVSDLQTGRTTTKGRGLEMMAIAGGGVTGAATGGRVGKDNLSKIGGLTPGEITESLRGVLQGAGYGKEDVDKMSAVVGGEPISAELLKNMISGNNAEIMRMVQANPQEAQKFFQQIRNSDLKDALGLKTTSPEKIFRDLASNLKSATAAGQALGLSPEELKAEMNAWDAEKQAKLQGKSEAQLKKELEDTAQKAREADAATNPQNMFKAAVEKFTGSVYVFAAATAGSAVMDSIKMFKNIKSAGGVKNYLSGATGEVGSGAGKALESLEATGEAATKTGKLGRAWGATKSGLGKGWEATKGLGSKLKFWGGGAGAAEGAAGLSEAAVAGRTATQAVEAGKTAATLGKLGRAAKFAKGAGSLAKSNLVSGALWEIGAGLIGGVYNSATEDNYFSTSNWGSAYEKRGKEFDKDKENLFGENKGFWTRAKGAGGYLMDGIGTIFGDLTETVYQTVGMGVKAGWDATLGGNPNQATPAPQPQPVSVDANGALIFPGYTVDALTLAQAEQVRRNNAARGPQ